MTLAPRHRQSTQVRRSDLYDDTIAPSEVEYETNPTSLEGDLNRIRSAINTALTARVGNWYDEISAPTSPEPGVARGIADISTALHALEKKRALRDRDNLVDITVPAGQNYVVLGAGELPLDTLAAVGAVNSLGTVVAVHGGTFGSHALSAVPAETPVNPANLVVIFDGSTRNSITSGSRQVFGLLQGESGLADGDTISDTTPDRVQISFVRVSSTGSGLEAAPVADIENKVIHYRARERVRLEELAEYDFLKSVGGGASGTGGGGGTGITETEHEQLDTLTHAIVEDSFDEIIRGCTVGKRRVDQVITWNREALPRVKLRELLITRTAGKVTQAVDIQYDGAGFEIYRVTEDISRIDGLASSITRTRT